MNFSERWAKADDHKKYQIREQSALRAKIQHLDRLYWREGDNWKIKLDDVIFDQPTKISAIEKLLSFKYGIKVRIDSEKPLKYEKLLESKPILNDEIFAASVNNETLSHIKGLTPIDWETIYQVLSKAAYNSNPQLQVPAALEVLKKLNANIKEKK